MFRGIFVGMAAAVFTVAAPAASAMAADGPLGGGASGLPGVGAIGPSFEVGRDVLCEVADYEYDLNRQAGLPGTDVGGDITVMAADIFGSIGGLPRGCLEEDACAQCSSLGGGDEEGVSETGEPRPQPGPEETTYVIPKCGNADRRSC